MKNMKKLISILLLFLTINVFAQEKDVKWYTNANEAAQIALSENKPLYLFFTGSDWCGWCIQLKKNIFSKSEFINWANENVILLELDFPKRKKLDQLLVQQNEKFRRMYNVRGYPTGIFVNVTKKETNFQFNEIARHAVELIPGSRKFVSPSDWTKTVDIKLSNKK